MTLAVTRTFPPAASMTGMMLRPISEAPPMKICISYYYNIGIELRAQFRFMARTFLKCLDCTIRWVDLLLFREFWHAGSFSRLTIRFLKNISPPQKKKKLVQKDTKGALQKILFFLNYGSKKEEEENIKICRIAPIHTQRIKKYKSTLSIFFFHFFYLAH